MKMQYIFCFLDREQAASAIVEKKKIERGIAVVVKWNEEGTPTITYESRFDFTGGASYRVKFNSSVWASFDSTNTAMVDEFRQALHELDAAIDARNREESKVTNKENNEGAAEFFRNAGELA